MPDTAPKFDDTLPADDTPPKFEDTVDAPKFDDTMPTDHDPEKENGERVWGLDTGTRVHHDAIKKLADKYGVPAETLERHAVRLGATYPDSSKGERALASGYHAADTMLANIPSWVQKKMTSLGEGGDTEAALDELKDTIGKDKTGKEKTADFVQSLGSPMRLPAAAAQKLAETGKYANAVATGAAVSGAYGLGNSKKGDELLDTAESGSAGGIAAPAVQFGLEKLLGSAGRLLGKGKETAQKYLDDDVTRSRVNDPEFNFENLQEDHFDAPRRGHIKQQGEAEAALAGAKDEAKLARDEAGQARQRLHHSLKSTVVPDDVPGLIDTGLSKQRAKIGDLAKQQTEMLEPVDDRYSIEHLLEGLKQSAEREKIDGKTLPNDPEVGGINDIQRMLESVRPSPKVTPREPTMDPFTMGLKEQPPVVEQQELSLRPADLAKLRQKIDTQIAPVYDQATGSYVQRSDRAGKQARSGINKVLDSQLPDDAGYKALRGELAAESQFGEQASDVFGKDRKYAKLSSLMHPNNRDDLALLAQLDKKHNLGVMDRLEPFFDAQRTLQDPAKLAAREAGLPEVQGSFAKNSTVDAGKDLVADLAAQHEPYSDITPGNGSQSAMRKLLFANSRRPETQTKDAVRALAEATGQDTMGAMDSLKVKEALGGGGPQGSRLVNMGRSVGKAIAGTPGEAIGGLAAGTLDYSTGKTLKLAMDGYLAAKDPTIRAAGVAASKIVDKLLSRGDDPKAQKYTAALTKAAERGPNAILAADMVLRKDPDYRALTDEGAK